MPASFSRYFCSGDLEKSVAAEVKIAAVRSFKKESGENETDFPSSKKRTVPRGRKGAAKDCALVVRFKVILVVPKATVVSYEQLKMLEQDIIVIAALLHVVNAIARLPSFYPL